MQRYLEEGLMTQEDIQNDLRILAGTCYEEYTDHFGSAENIALYHGPIEILISHKTMSAAEDFVAMFRSNYRAVIKGEATFGSTGTPYHIKLRCGGRAQVVSVGYRLIDGTEFIGVGIQPD